jgi:short chain dehydrogenase
MLLGDVHDVRADEYDRRAASRWSRRPSRSPGRHLAGELAGCGERCRGDIRSSHDPRNNAGIYELGGAESADIEEWERVIAVNQTGVFLGMKTVIPSMRRAGGGTIVNISSVHGLVGSPNGIGYHASKGAVRLMTKQAARRGGRVPV